MLWILNFFLGWVRVEVRGAYPERFLNLCAKNQIAFWDMERVSPDLIRVSVTVANFRKLKSNAKKAMCHLHIVSKHGLRFFTVHFKKRIALIIGLMFFLGITWMSTSFVWKIDISGNNAENIHEIEKHLRDNGVYIGAYIPNIDIGELKNDVRIKMPDLSYIGININGSHVYVSVRNRTNPPPLESKEDEPCNIVARRGGMISSIVVQSGTPEVAKGDAVTEGQLLASGYMTGRSGSTALMHAKADVRARTWYTITSIFPLDTIFKEYTGQSENRYTLILGKRRLKLYFNSGIHYEECDKIIKTSFLTFPGGISFPIALEKQTLHEYKKREGMLSEETALEYIAEKLANQPEVREDARVIDRRYSAEFKGDVARITMIAECEESIGVEQRILKGE